jgi:hypothetical protein
MLSTKKEIRKINLSDLNPYWETDELIDYLLDIKTYILVNDLSDKKPFIEYEMQDLYTVWDNLRLLLIFKI